MNIGSCLYHIVEDQSVKGIQGGGKVDFQL